MERLKTARNVLIVAAIAAGVKFLPEAERALETFVAALWVAFGIGIAYLGLRLYRENRVALHGLGDRHRGMLYAALAGVVFLLTARSRMWNTGIGELLWFALAALAVYALLATYRYWRSY
jgi:TRAP-type C4-dicarboxylate transport system permease small subunit